jgi:hypothetical protein
MRRAARADRRYVLPQEDDVTTHDSASFAAGLDTGARLSACVVRLTALQLMDDSRWWNRWRRRLMAGALLTCAVELEDTAGALGASAPGEVVGQPGTRADIVHLVA